MQPIHHLHRPQAALSLTRLHRLEALPLGLFGLEGDVHALRVKVMLAQTLEPLVCVLEALFEVVLGGEQPELALKPRLPPLEVSGGLGCLWREAASSS